MREEILNILRTDYNPMCSRISIIYSMGYHNVDSHHPLYGKVGYWLAKFEREDLVFTFRHINQGTTYLLRERIKTHVNINDNFPF